MHINFTFDNANQAPAGFVSAVQSVGAYFDHLYADSITVNIRVGWGEENGITVKPLAASQNNSGSYSYAQVRNALISHATTPTDAISIANDLPLADPTGGQVVVVSTAEQRALGLPISTNIYNGVTGFDGAIGFVADNSYPWTFDPDQRGVSGKFDIFGEIFHETSEVLGRVSNANVNGQVRIPDLFRYSSNGQRQLGTGSPAYFSINGGTTNLGEWNGDPALGDNGDWAPSVGPDAVLNGSFPSHPNPWTERDSELLDVLGYNRVAQKDDYNGDNTADIMLRDNASGAVSDWSIALGGYAGSTQIGGVGSSTQLIGSGDFNHDGTDDLLLRDTSGAVSIWILGNGHFQASQQLGGMGGNLTIQGIGDFNHDGTSDVLYRDNTTGGISVWTVNNNAVSASTQIGGMGSNLQIQGVGDFNGDGTSDVLYRDNTTGGVSVWTVNNHTVTNSTQIGGMGGNILIVGTGDFTGSGTDDVAYEDTNTGAVSYWTVKNNSVTGATQIGGVPSGWNVAGVRDVNGDGIADILVHDNSSGAIGAFTVNGAGQFNSYLSIGAIPSSFSVVA